MCRMCMWGWLGNYALTSLMTTYIHLKPEFALPEINLVAPFRMVVIVEAVVTSAWQNAVSDWIVRSGCLYMMAWGLNCSTWDDSVDWANIDEFQFKEIPEDRFVMTTWHANVPLEEAFLYSKNNASHSTVDIKQENTFLLHISLENRQQEILAAYAAA
jgi:hypothetical protein